MLGPNKRVCQKEKIWGTFILHRIYDVASLRLQSGVDIGQDPGTRSRDSGADSESWGNPNLNRKWGLRGHILQGLLGSGVSAGQEKVKEALKNQIKKKRGTTRKTRREGNK